MKIWVDADACPGVVKEILFRAADRTGVQLTLVANQALSTPSSPNINSVQVPRGFDVADDEIVKAGFPRHHAVQWGRNGWRSRGIQSTRQTDLCE
jgi:uncharacterized protein YaiI (UPF0178 family)